MTGLVIEGGIYFLLVFVPFAFGGVETWAQGVLQIVAGAIVAAWAWERFGRRLPSQRQAAPGAAALWIPMGLMVLLVAAQLVPMPPAWLARLSPATQALYARTLPEYAEGKPFESGALGPWIVQ